MKPDISIIVPVHNTELYLRDCLNSILHQIFSNIEVILVNDGSTDNSGFICDEFAKKDNRVKVVHKEFAGVSSVRNTGVKIAQGTFIGFVDGDDRIEPTMYEKLLQLCKETESDISICTLGREVNGELTNGDLAKEPYIKEMDHIEALRQLFKGILYRFSLCNKLFHRKCFQNVQFPEGRIHEDLATTYKLFANANKSVFTNEIGYIYVKRQESILTSRFSEKRLGAFIGWDEIITFMSREYPQLLNDVTASFAYGCIDNLYYVLDQVEGNKEKRKYLQVIQTYVRKYYKKMIKNDILSRKYKLLITLVNVNTRTFYLINHVKKYFFNSFNLNKRKRFYEAK